MEINQEMLSLKLEELVTGKQCRKGLQAGEGRLCVCVCLCTGIRDGRVCVGVGGKGTGLIYQLIQLIITKPLRLYMDALLPNVSFYIRVTQFFSQLFRYSLIPSNIIFTQKSTVSCCTLYKT